MQMDVTRQKKSLSGYYAAVSFMDAQVGRVLDALEKSGQADNTIIIFTSDHGYHLGEHDFWAKVSLHDESARVPLIVSVPGKKPGVSDSLIELLDLYPTTAKLCGLEVPTRLQGKDISPILDDPKAKVHDTVFSVAGTSKGLMLRDERWVFIQYTEDASKGMELFDMHNDPKQLTNLASSPDHVSRVEEWKAKITAKLLAIRANDLGN